MNINEFPQQVNQVISIAETILQGQILGIYLYGSATMNGLRPDSDIDILIITKQELSNSIRADLTKQLLKISGSVGCIEKRPLEVTIINQSDIVPLQFPPKCQYMYGEWLRGEMEAGEYPQVLHPQLHARQTSHPSPHKDRTSKVKTPLEYSPVRSFLINIFDSFVLLPYLFPINWLFAQLLHYN